jgi:EAL domain-containing protein (putative c-di-GMP-specific phosphodiesterase class I)
MGCDQIQGFFVARPMAADDFERWAAGRARPAIARTGDD